MIAATQSMCSDVSEYITQPMSHQCDCHVVGRRSNMVVTAMVDNVHRKWNPFWDIHNIPFSPNHPSPSHNISSLKHVDWYLL